MKARALAAVALLVCAILVALGSWQLARRAWKLDLIDRVEQRVHAMPVAAPGAARWPLVNAAEDEYRRVSVSGTLLHDRETLVQAVTDLGGGFWVMTPLRQDDGTLVLVNRGFVPPERKARSTRAEEGATRPVRVNGLLRLTESGGVLLGRLRRNDPAADRWYWRDVQAIAAARDLRPIAPYFIDAEAAPEPGGPVGGLTVIAFRNHHLVYALTWYVLAGMAAAAAWRLMHTKGCAATTNREPSG